MRTLLMALALAACSAPAPGAGTAPPSSADTLTQMPPWDGARAAGVDFRGVGEEPGWMLDIYERERIVMLWDYGEQSAAFPLPEAQYPQEGATRYATQADGHTLTITIRRAPCQDTMSGEAFPASVEAVIDGRTLSGCGRTV